MRILCFENKTISKQKDSLCQTGLNNRGDLLGYSIGRRMGKVEFRIGLIQEIKSSRICFFCCCCLVDWFFFRTYFYFDSLLCLLWCHLFFQTSFLHGVQSSKIVIFKSCSPGVRTSTSVALPNKIKNIFSQKS